MCAPVGIWCWWWWILKAWHCFDLSNNGHQHLRWCDVYLSHSNPPLGLPNQWPGAACTTSTTSHWCCLRLAACRDSNDMTTPLASSLIGIESILYLMGVGSSSGPGPRARAGMGPVGGARGSPRGPVEPASPRSPVRSSTVQYFVVLCSTK